MNDNLIARLNASPTGRQLATDGSFVFEFTTADPTASILSPPDGTAVMYEDANSGDRFLYTFTRATGWKSVQLA